MSVLLELMKTYRHLPDDYKPEKRIYRLARQVGRNQTKLRKAGGKMF
tara:strand:+ start:376 stop:516 length:141 start_codon:yes stop_codon:yes gene_type:complete